MAKRQATDPSPAPRRLICYARVSTDDQVYDAQMDDLRAACCERIFQEHGPGASRARPVLTRLLGELAAGDVLAVVRLDRLARSVSHLLQVIEDLEERGVYFRSIRDPIDTSTPQGMFSLQVLRAVAQLERALIAERTKAGINLLRQHCNIHPPDAVWELAAEGRRDVPAGTTSAHDELYDEDGLPQ